MRVGSSALAIVLLCSSAVVAYARADAALPLEAKTVLLGEPSKQRSPTDRQIKKILIAESIAAYSGNCPCPYNTARNGSRCGKRSAWSRAGGEAPLCFESDVSAEMVQQYRDAHPEQ